MYTVTQVKAKQSFQGASGRAEGSRAQSRAPGWAVGTVTTHRGAGVTTHRGVGVTTNRGAGQDHPQEREPRPASSGSSPGAQKRECVVVDGRQFWVKLQK